MMGFLTSYPTLGNSNPSTNGRQWNHPAFAFRPHCFAEPHVATTNIEPTISNEWFEIKARSKRSGKWTKVREKDMADRPFEEVSLDRIQRHPKLFHKDLVVAASILRLDHVIETSYISKLKALRNNPKGQERLRARLKVLRAKEVERTGGVMWWRKPPPPDSESDDDPFSEEAAGDRSFDSGFESAHVTTPLPDEGNEGHTDSSWSQVSCAGSFLDSPSSPSLHLSSKPANDLGALGITPVAMNQSFLDMSNVSPSPSLHDRQTASSSTSNFRGKNRAPSQVHEAEPSDHSDITEDDWYHFTFESPWANDKASDDMRGDKTRFKLEQSGPITPVIDVAKSLAQSRQPDFWPLKANNPACRLPGEIIGVIGLMLDASGYHGDLDRLAWACRHARLDSGPSRLMIMPISQHLLETLMLPSRKYGAQLGRIGERVDAAWRARPETTRLLLRCSSASYAVFNDLITINAHDLTPHADGRKTLDQVVKVIITTELFDRIRRKALAGYNLDTAISKTVNFIAKTFAQTFVMCISPPTVRPLPKDIPDETQHINEELGIGAVTDAINNLSRMPSAPWIFWHNIKAGDICSGNFYGNAIVELAPDNAPAGPRYGVSIGAQKVLMNYMDWHLTLFLLARSISGLKPGMLIIIRYAHRLDPLGRKDASSYFRRRLVHSLFTYERPKLVSFDWDNATAKDAEEAVETHFWKTLENTEAYVKFDKRVDEHVQFDDSPVHPPCNCCWVRPE